MERAARLVAAPHAGSSTRLPRHSLPARPPGIAVDRVSRRRQDSRPLHPAGEPRPRPDAAFRGRCQGRRWSGRCNRKRRKKLAARRPRTLSQALRESHLDLHDIYLELSPADIAYVKFIFESYEEVGIIRTIDNRKAVVVLL